MPLYGTIGYNCTVVQELILCAQRRHTLFNRINVRYLGQWGECSGPVLEVS